MDTEPTLQTLQFDCLLHLLKYVPLPECMSLRSTCRHLKNVVDEHFRINVRTLPILLTAPFFPKNIEHYEQYWKSDTVHQYEKIIVGRTSGERQFWEKRKTFVGEKMYFRLEDYLILTRGHKVRQFTSFITKYLPGITKLALLIDNDIYFQNIWTITSVLEVYRKQLKIAHLDMPRPPSSLTCFGEIQLPVDHELFDTIVNLESIEELYLFCNNKFILRHGREESSNQYFERIFRKLRILHIDYDPHLNFRSQPEVYENLIELACRSEAGIRYFSRFGHSFPNLEKCIFFDIEHYQYHPVLPVRNQNSEQMPKLQEFRFSNLLVVQHCFMERLNDYLNLRRIHCASLHFNSLNHQLPDNTTVEIIEIDTLCYYSYNRFDYNYNYNRLDSPEGRAEAWRAVKHCLTFFKHLQKLIIREPPLELTRGRPEIEENPLYSGFVFPSCSCEKCKI